MASLPIRIALAVFGFAIAPLYSAEKVAAIVNGEPIPVAEIDSTLAHVPKPETPVSAVQIRQQRSEILQILIDDKLVRQYLQQHGPKIESADVERQLAALEASQKAKGKTLGEYLKEDGLTLAQVRENFLRMLQLAKYVDGQATPERLQAYFDANRDLFDGTTVRTSHIVLRFGKDASPADRKKAIDKMKSIRAEIAAQRIDFPAAAKKHSQCPTASKGGDLGQMVRKFQAEEAYARAAFALKVGEVSDVVETESGVHLIWCTERKPGKPAKFEVAQADVRECFEAELKNSLLTELRKRAKIEIKMKD